MLILKEIKENLSQKWPNVIKFTEELIKEKMEEILKDYKPYPAVYYPPQPNYYHPQIIEVTKPVYCTTNTTIYPTIKP